jgi:hypothetical protein
MADIAGTVKAFGGNSRLGILRVFSLRELAADSPVNFPAFLAGAKRLVQYRPPKSPVKLRAFIASGTNPLT